MVTLILAFIVGMGAGLIVFSVGFFLGRHSAREEIGRMIADHDDEEHDDNTIQQWLDR